MTTIAYQLYCSRNFLPLGDTLAMLSAAGYKEVEGYGALFEDVDALKAAVDASGLAMTTAHFGLEMLEDDPAKAISAARDFGMKTLYVPFVGVGQRPTDAVGWAGFAARLAEAVKPVLDAGIQFGWHNHAFEFEKLDSVELPIEFIANAFDGMTLELDLGWVRVAGHDPVAWINKFGSKISAAHIKDIAPDGECADEDGWADVGHGIMDWKTVHAALQANGVTHYVVEHDNPKDDKRFATRSLAAIQNF